ncbi:MAG: hypothetical protein ACK528_13650 [Alphaproteobacteria bacterium]
MTRNPREIERAFKQVRRQDFLLDLKRSWYAWAIIGVLLVGLAYYNATPRTAGEVVYGTAIGAHQPASEDNNKPMMMAVRLDSGRAVTVPLPRGLLYLSGSRVELEVTRREWPPHLATYRFMRYSE